MDHKIKEKETTEEMLCYPMMCPIMQQYMQKNNIMQMEENNPVNVNNVLSENEITDDDQIMPENENTLNMRSSMSEIDNYNDFQYEEYIDADYNYNYMYEDNFRQLNRVDQIISRIEIDNPDIYRVFASYGIRRPDARRIIRRIIRLTLQYER